MCHERQQRRFDSTVLTVEPLSQVSHSSGQQSPLSKCPTPASAASSLAIRKTHNEGDVTFPSKPSVPFRYRIQRGRGKVKLWLQDRTRFHESVFHGVTELTSSVTNNEVRLGSRRCCRSTIFRRRTSLAFFRLGRATSRIVVVGLPRTQSLAVWLTTGSRMCVVVLLKLFQNGFEMVEAEATRCAIGRSRRPAVCVISWSILDLLSHLCCRETSAGAGEDMSAWRSRRSATTRSACERLNPSSDSV